MLYGDIKNLCYAVNMRTKKSLRDLRGILAEATELVRPGTVWRHYKGGIYTVTSLAFDEESLDIEVIYSPMDAEDITFTRWLSIWLETVEWQGAHIPRFELISK